MNMRVIHDNVLQYANTHKTYCTQQKVIPYWFGQTISFGEALWHKHCHYTNQTE